jgi:putative transposase
MEASKPYPTAFSDRAWAVMQPLVPTAKPGGRPERDPNCDIFEAIFFLLRGGCAWRLLPHDCPLWQLVSQDFWQWRHDGTWQHKHDRLRGAGRVAAGTRRQPSAGLSESQSVKTTDKGGSGAMTRVSRSKGVSVTSSLTPAGSASSGW